MLKNCLKFGILDFFLYLCTVKQKTKEMFKVRCIEQLQTKALTFKPGDEYEGNSVNENWWVIDSVGVSTEDFNLHFEILEDVIKVEPVISEKDAGMPIEETISEQPIAEEKHSFLERVRGYIFA